jgi:hypothetical protein
MNEPAFPSLVAPKMGGLLAGTGYRVLDSRDPVHSDDLSAPAFAPCSVPVFPGCH